MEKFKMKIPDGYVAEIENGDVVYYPIMHEEKRPFEIGDIVSLGNILRVIEGFDNNGWVESSKRLQVDTFYSGCYKVCGDVFHYSKATPEQERLFRQKCLENNVWFDQVNKKWIALQEGGFYTIEDFIFIYDSYEESDNSLKFKAALKNKSYIDIYDKGLTIIRVDWSNISEAIEEEKQSLFDALKEEGKRWNAENKCIDDIKWVPKVGEAYWSINTVCEPIKISNGMYPGDVKRINAGNCFHTKEKCEKYAEYMKECSLKYKQ